MALIPCMSAKLSARPLLSHGLRGRLAGPALRAGRSFSATTIRRSSPHAGSEGSANTAQSGWHGNSVWAVALAAGAVGWGLASSTKGNSATAGFLPLGSGLLSSDGLSRPVTYASMAEMEQVFASQYNNDCCF